jgi:uncharacterized protein
MTVALHRTRNGPTEQFYAPAAAVLVGPSLGSLKPIWDVSRVSYKDSINQIDSFEITVGNMGWAPGETVHTSRIPGGAAGAGNGGGTDARDFTPEAQAGEDILPGHYARLWMGYEGATGLRPMLTGRITSVTPGFTEGGVTLSVRALSTLEAFRGQRRNQQWRLPGGRTITDTEVAQLIVRDYDVTLLVASGRREVPETSITQNNESDIGFLMRRGKRLGYVLLYREVTDASPVTRRDVQGVATRKVLYFGPSPILTASQIAALGMSEDELDLRWGASLIELRPSLNLSSTIWKKVRVGVWDRRDRSRPSTEYSVDELISAESDLNGDLRPLLRDDLLGEHELSGEPVRNRDDGMVLLRAAMRENFLTAVTADGSTVGHPDLRSGAKVRIGGVGPIFNGTWFVTSTTHTLDDSGYLTQFSARRENTRAA